MDAETRAERLAELSKKLNPASASADYRDLLKKDIDAVYISATPESTHYPIARDFLSAGRHVFLEKPIAMTLAEAVFLAMQRASTRLGSIRSKQKRITRRTASGMRPVPQYS